MAAPAGAGRAGRGFWRRLALAFALLWLVTGALALRLWLDSLPGPPAPPRPGSERPVPERLVVEERPWEDLPGWRADTTADALAAFLASCRALAGVPPERALGEGGWAGTAALWHDACRSARGVPAGDHAAARRYFEERFRPLAVFDGDDRVGLFTGYYEPLLQGSRQRSGRFRVPLHRRPRDIVSVDLGEFREDLAGRRIAGRLRAGTLEPYPDRGAIVEGALAGRDLELLWVDDPVDAFFLQIQGSGRVELAEGGSVRVGYAGQNGRTYTAIGRVLVERGELSRDEVSLQSIAAWLRAHPEEADEVMDANRSYVFFRLLPGDGPVGSQGVVLTAGRSLAVDRGYHPMGLPVWLDARTPAPEPGAPDRVLRRLLIAQDTGGAIRGPVRGDVFWGAGEEAEEVAGRMKHRGRMWALAPRP